MQNILIGRQYPEKVIELIKQAKQSIKIIVFDWRWYGDQIGSINQKFNYEICQAVRRGVEISAVCDSPKIDNILRNQGVKVFNIPTKKTIHVKMILIDNKILVLGSHNFTKSAFELNHEISVLIEDQESINSCNTFFNELCRL
jgi:phosphatidylserine/phosphatidylglycerophosphate/cardiolipin synthase-like enzyme